MLDFFFLLYQPDFLFASFGNIELAMKLHTARNGGRDCKEPLAVIVRQCNAM